MILRSLSQWYQTSAQDINQATAITNVAKIYFSISSKKTVFCITIVSVFIHIFVEVISQQELIYPSNTRSVVLGGSRRGFRLHLLEHYTPGIIWNNYVLTLLHSLTYVIAAEKEASKLKTVLHWWIGKHLLTKYVMLEKRQIILWQ